MKVFSSSNANHANNRKSKSGRQSSFEVEELASPKSHHTAPDVLKNATDIKESDSNYDLVVVQETESEDNSTQYEMELQQIRNGEKVQTDTNNSTVSSKASKYTEVSSVKKMTKSSKDKEDLSQNEKYSAAKKEKKKKKKTTTKGPSSVAEGSRCSKAAPSHDDNSTKRKKPPCGQTPPSRILFNPRVPLSGRNPSSDDPTELLRAKMSQALAERKMREGYKSVYCVVSDTDLTPKKTDQAESEMDSTISSAISEISESLPSRDRDEVEDDHEEEYDQDEEEESLRAPFIANSSSWENATNFSQSIVTLDTPNDAMFVLRVHDTYEDHEKRIMKNRGWLIHQFIELGEDMCMMKRDLFGCGGRRSPTKLTAAPTSPASTAFGGSHTARSARSSVYF